MKNKEDDIDFSEEAFKSRFKRIARPKFLDKIAPQETKSRITIYLDTNVLDRFKEMAKEEHVGYQTLINSALKNMVNTEKIGAERQSLKKALLEDKKFLNDLKKALT